jgi:glucosamine-6-phosphate deaminase
MKIHVLKNPEDLGRHAALQSADAIRDALESRGEARIVLSTGASQLETLHHLAKADLDWSRVEMFHLDEYIGLPESHPASFRRYLKERFVEKTGLKKINYVNGEGRIEEHIKKLTHMIRGKQIDVALIGIGENAHVAFNDPPADFTIREAYIIVDLDERCKLQQVREGWFSSVDKVPKQAISMTVHQIMQSRMIISSVPHAVKAKAVKAAITSFVTPDIPASILKTHSDFSLYLDQDSAALLPRDLLTGNS